MNYYYMIKDEKIYEFETKKETTYDKFGHTIKFIVENIEKKSAFSPAGKRKSEWLLNNHPEFFI